MNTRGYGSRLNAIYDLLYGIKWKIAIQPDILRKDLIIYHSIDRTVDEYGLWFSFIKDLTLYQIKPKTIVKLTF
jgi:hypothetical protein